MASRNGLNPKIKAPKGIAYGRALPAAFGFGNGINPAGGNMRIPALERGTTTISPSFTYEFWTKCNAGPADSLFFYWATITKSSSPTYALRFTVNSGPLGLSSTDGGFSNSATHIDFDGSRQHIVYAGRADGSGIVDVYYNGVTTGTCNGLINSFTPDAFTLFASGYGANSLIDEVRYYTYPLSYNQIVTNYNNGLGNNPSITETLLLWYQFQSFETLDFSSAQDGSDIRIGMRDMSNNSNHGFPVGIDTNPASSTYSLQLF